MSNTPKAGNGSYSLAKYRKKIDTAKGAFVLMIDDDKSIVIERPSGEQTFNAEAAFQAGDSREFIAAICGDVAGEVLDLISDEDAAVGRALVLDLQKHFGLG